MNRGSLSDMTFFGMPNQGIMWRKYRAATCALVILVVHFKNLAALEQPWSTIVRMALVPSNGGRSVIRSMAIVWKGPFIGSTGMGCSGAF